MARFTETVDIRPSPLINIDVSPLTSKLDAFASQQASIRAKKIAEASFDKGVASFKKGEKPEFKKERFFGNIGSTSYNKGLRAAYVASIDRDNRENIARIAAENSDDLSKFNDEVETYKKFTLGNIDPTARDIVAESMESLVSTNRIRVQNNEISRTHKESAQAIIGQVELASRDAMGFARDGDDIASAESALAAFASVDAAVDAGFITPESGIKQKRDIERGLVENKETGNLFRVFDSSGEVAAFDKLDSLASKRPRGFTPDEWDDFIAKAQTDLNRKVNRRRQNDNEQAKENSLNESIARGLLFTSPDIPADPSKSSQDRKDINNYYDSASPLWRGDQNQLIENNVSFVKNTGLVPNGLISSVGAVMRSGSPDQVVSHMEIIQRIQQDSPNSIRDFSEESRAIAVQVSDAISNGIDAETAIAAARKNTFGLTPTQKEEIRIASRGERKVQDRIKSFEKMVSNEFDPIKFPVVGMFVDEPDIPPGMQASYLSNFDNFMSLTNGNIEQSEKLAFDSLKNVWGVTKVGKRRFMQYPPEAFYHVDGVDDEWIEEQFLEDMESIGVDGAEIGIDDLVSRSDSPSYPVVAMRPGGFVDIIEDEDGNVLRFKPDFKKTREYQDLVSAPGKARESAAQKRMRNLENRAGVIRRKVNSRVFMENIDETGDKPGFLASDAGKASVRKAVNNLLAIGDIDQVEAKEVLDAYGAGDIKDIPVFRFLNNGNNDGIN
ncbi:MAG: hypothetical protein OEX12_01090 [Gammaproteobacteria bacterium]|nr:hypothetical protein [Gammaproteobacteria bacterium]